MNSNPQKDDDRRAILKDAKRALSEVMRSKEETAAGRKRKPSVKDELLTPCTKKSAKTSLTGTQKTGSKELDSKITSYFYENGIAFNAAASSSFVLMTEESMKLKIQFQKFARQNPLQSYKVPRRLKFPEFHSHDHSAGAWALKDLFFMCYKVHGARSAASAKAQLDWSVRTRRRLIFFRTKQCALMLQRCRQRHGMRCT